MSCCLTGSSGGYHWAGTNSLTVSLLRINFETQQGLVLDMPRRRVLSCSKTPPSVKASAYSRLAGPSPRVIGRVAAFWNGTRFQNSPQVRSADRNGWGGILSHYY